MYMVHIYIPSLMRDWSYMRALSSLSKEAEVCYVIGVGGVSGGSSSVNHNLGILSCMGGDYIGQLNSDCAVLTEGWLGKLLETLVLYSDIGLVSPKIVMNDGTIFSCGTAPNLRNYCSGEVDLGQREYVEEVVAAPSNCYLYNRRIFEELGIRFDEHFIRSGSFMDTDFCLRLRKGGYRIFYDGRVKVLHHRAQTQGSWHSWNHLYFHLKHPSTFFRVSQKLS